MSPLQFDQTFNGETRFENNVKKIFLENNSVWCLQFLCSIPLKSNPIILHFSMTVSLFLFQCNKLY